METKRPFHPSPVPAPPARNGPPLGTPRSRVAVDFRYVLLGLVFPPGGFAYWYCNRAKWPRRCEAAVDGALWGCFLIACLLIIFAVGFLVKPQGTDPGTGVVMGSITSL